MSFSKKEIVFNTLGGLLKKARLSKNFTLSFVSQKIKIEEKYLRLLELDDYSQLPGSVYFKNFIKKYAEFLGLDSEEMINQWEKENEFYKNKDHKKARFRSLSHLKKINFKFFFVLFFVILVFFYLGFGIKKVLFPPKIQIIFPQEDFVVQESNLIIKGKTEEKSDVFINDQPIVTTISGYFEQSIELLPGLNIIKISAQKKYSKEASVYRRVVLE